MHVHLPDLVLVGEQLQQVGAATGLAQGFQPQRRQNVPHFVRDVDQVLGQRARIAFEGLSVGGQTCRALDVTVLGHDALEHHQRRCPELEAVTTQQRRLDDIRAGLVGARAAQGDLLAQAGAAQRLMHLGEADFSRAAGVLQRCDLRSAGPAGVPGDVDDISPGLGHADGDGANALGGDQLDDHPHPRGLTIVDQLRKVFDRIGIVMGRR